MEIPQTNSFDQLEAKHDLDKLLQDLSPKLRETIVLFSIEELSLEDISQILQIPEGTVKSRINLAKMQMSEILKKRKS
jgi:RNA polymerase sigma-70 factor (ECF subfamily)